MRWMLSAWLPPIVLAACAGRRPQPLPGRIGDYTGGPLVTDASFIRREYTRDKVHVSVTIARYPTNDEQFQQWVQMSAGYPAARLDVPAGTGAGFYDCSKDPAHPVCNLHIQLKPSFHIEVMGEGTATRADLEELLHGLPLRALQAEAPSGK